MKISTELSEQAVINTIISDLSRAGVLASGNLEVYASTLKSYDPETLVKTLIHAHGLKEARLAFEDTIRKTWSDMGWSSTVLNNTLSQEYKNKGYKLTEDEDFLYLHPPESKGLSPLVFHAKSTGIEDIISAILTIESN